MATIAAPQARRRNDRLFYTGTGLYLAALVFAGFARSFYLSHWFAPPRGTPDIGPLLVMHGIVFTGWVGLMVVQPMLIAQKKRKLHRRLGYAGAVLAALMVVLGNLVAIAAMHGGFKGLGDPYAFYSVPFFAIQGFAIAVALAILWRERAETHKRLMVLASVIVVEAGTARLPLAAVDAGAPFSFFAGGDIVIVAGILYDLWSRGRIHPAWLWGGGAVVASQIGKLLVSQTAAWLGFAHMMAGLWPA
jgi:uncharacterized membrane protein YozB (DUF420 family)